MGDIDRLIARFSGLGEAERKEVATLAAGGTVGQAWFPNPGPQTDAFFSLADLLLYGGQGGGGKSHLLLGLGFTAHRRSLILRRQLSDLDDMIAKALEINGGKDGFVGGGRPKLTTRDGRLLAFAGNKDPGDEMAWQGQRFDLKAFDEVCQFLESQVRFHLGWVGTTDPDQRTRAVFASNPPVNAIGEWIIGWFRPWLDVTHPKPAKHGELRWYVTANDGADLEVDGPEPVQLEGRKLIPKSRTFIPASLGDNPFLVRTNYQQELDALPEPLRSAVRDGNFMAARPDADNQVIPTNWILEAQGRWKPDGWKEFLMTAMAVDPAGGGADAMEIAFRHGGWFGEPVSRTGPETEDGSKMAAEILMVRRNACPIIVDVGGGYGGAIMLRLKDNQITAARFNGAETSTGTTKDGAKLRFANKRAEAWWRMREELNPDQEGGSVVALPSNPELRSDLAAPTWELSPRGILIESKDRLRERLGRSPGKGDAVVMCLSPGDQAVKREMYARQRGPLPTRANVGHAHLKRGSR